MLDLVAPRARRRARRSRLYKRLVYDEQIATDVRGLPGRLGDRRHLRRPGDGEAGRRPRGGREGDRRGARPPAEGRADRGELERAKTERLAALRARRRAHRRLRRQVRRPRAEPGLRRAARTSTRTRLERVQAATAGPGLGRGEALALGRRLRARGPSLPAARRQRPRAPTARRGRSPATPPAGRLPAFQRATLANGLKLVVAERHEVPVVRFELLVDAGYAADSLGVRRASRASPATCSTKGRPAAPRSRSATSCRGSAPSCARARASTGPSSRSPRSSSNLEPVARALRRRDAAPVLPGGRAASASSSRPWPPSSRRSAQPFAMALRVLPRLIYGAGHAYANPFTGSGTEATVSGITREQVARWHATWFKPNNATLVVVGDTTLAEIRRRLEALFAAWKRGDVPREERRARPGEDAGRRLPDRPARCASSRRSSPATSRRRAPTRGRSPRR